MKTSWSEQFAFGRLELLGTKRHRLAVRPTCRLRHDGGGPRTGTALLICVAAIGIALLAGCRRQAKLPETSHAVPVEVMEIVPARL
jgi:hypothetical protein